jgi:glutamate---cysteine ligase / carboxylate-amine ligase
VKIPFNASSGTSLGVEWELMLVDRQTRELRGDALDVLAGMVARAGLAPGEEHPKAKLELLQNTIEVITGICTTVSEATKDLDETVAQLRAVAEPRGLGLMCAGTHPLTAWATQEVSPRPRYERLVEDMQLLARQLQIFGVHVHVGVRSADKAMPIVNALTQYIPHFLAVTASSPYWLGQDTGLASMRSKVFEMLPTAGLPYQLEDWTAFEAYMETLLSTRTISSIKEVWWDIRPHPEFGTVELRICDGIPTLHEVGMVAALAQCLVDKLDAELDRGYVLPMPKGWVVRENKWRAARFGLDAEIIVGESDTVVPLRESLEELVHDLRPVAERLGCAEELARVGPVLETGASYQRQRAVAAASGGDLTAVVDSLLLELEGDAPTALPGLPVLLRATGASGAGA